MLDEDGHYVYAVALRTKLGVNFCWNVVPVRPEHADTMNLARALIIGLGCRFKRQSEEYQSESVC
jgi:hypothetical protein